MRQETLVFLDRFEGGLGVILISGEHRQFSLPRRCFPQGAKEGQYYLLILERKEEEEEAMRSEVSHLLKDLTDSP